MGKPAAQVKRELVARLEGLVEGIGQLDNSHYRSRDLADTRCELVWRIRHECPHLNHTQISMYAGLDRSTVSFWLGKSYCNVAGMHARIEADRKRQTQERMAQRELMRLRKYHSRMPPREEWNTIDRDITPEREEHVGAVRQRWLEKREKEWAAMATVPADTRNTTARQFGDPLPGRSALDQRRAQQQAA